MVFRLKKPCHRDEDRHNEPAKQTAQNKEAEVFLLRRRAAPDRFFHDISFSQLAFQHKFW